MTGESLALLTDGKPFSLLLFGILLAEKTLLARPGDAVIVPGRLVPRNDPGSTAERSVREGFVRSWPGGEISLSGEF